jgi:colicin import membrane protein
MISIKHTFIISLFLHFTLFVIFSLTIPTKVIFSRLPLPVELVSLPRSPEEMLEDDKVEAIKRMLLREKELVLPKKFSLKTFSKSKLVEDTTFFFTEQLKEAAPPAKDNFLETAAVKPSASEQPVVGISAESKAVTMYGYYLAIIRERVGSNWQWPSSGRKYKAVVYFRILDDGRVEGLRIEKSSGDPLYDQSVLRAVMLSAPFPPLPEELSKKGLKIHFEFCLQ